MQSDIDNTYIHIQSHTYMLLILDAKFLTWRAYTGAYVGQKAMQATGTTFIASSDEARATKTKEHPGGACTRKLATM